MSKKEGRVINVTLEEVHALIIAQYNAGCKMLHEQHPILSKEQVRGVFERRVVSTNPAVEDVLARIVGRPRRRRQRVMAK